MLGRDPFGGEEARGGRTLEAASGSVCPEPSFASAQTQPSERESVCVCVYVCVFVFMIGGDTGGPEHSQPVPNPFRIPMTPV